METLLIILSAWYCGLVSVALAIHIANFRSYVVWSTTECSCLDIICNSLLTNPKVSDLDVTFAVQQDIIQFEISIDKTLIMEMEQPKTNLSSIEAIIVWRVY